MSFQTEKDIIRAFYADLDAAQGANVADVMTKHCSPSLKWRGFYPFDDIASPSEVAARFWCPLKNSLTRLQRRMDIFFAGQNCIDDVGGVWVSSMGHLMGLFDQPWLGIPPTGKMAFLRYCAFHRVEDGQIVETAMYFDIPHLMVQAGLQPFAHQTAAQLVQPGPMTHAGLLFDAQPTGTGAATLSAIEAMIADLGQWNSGMSLEEELARTWADDMIWWGPTGIGATYTIERYAKQHSGPFRAAFSGRSRTNHICRMAEGHYGGFFGWPNFSATLSGPFIDLEPNNQSVEFRVIDIYRRNGAALAENWVFIDLPYFYAQIGQELIPEVL